MSLSATPCSDERNVETGGERRRHMYFLCPQVQEEDDDDTLHQAAIERELLQV